MWFRSQAVKNEYQLIFVLLSLSVCVFPKLGDQKRLLAVVTETLLRWKTKNLFIFFANVCVYFVRVRCVLELDSLLLLSKWFVFIHRSYVSLLSFTQTQFMASQMWFFRRTVCMVCVVCFFSSLLSVLVLLTICISNRS